MRNKYCLLLVFLFYVQHVCFAQEKLKVVLAGLTHDHVDGTLDKYKNGQLEIIGIAESNKELCEKKKTKYQLPDVLFFKDLKTALQKHPDLVMAYNSPSEHLGVVEKCLP